MFNRNAFQRFEIKILALHRDIHLEQNRTTEEIKHVQTEMQEQSLLQSIQLMLSEYHRLFDRIRRTLMDARSGKINEMIPKETTDCRPQIHQRTTGVNATITNQPKFRGHLPHL